MNAEAIINDEIAIWKDSVELANKLFMEKSGMTEAPLRVREALAGGMYFAVSICEERGISTGIATAEHDQIGDTTAIITMTFKRAVAITDLPAPFNALALSRGHCEIVSEIRGAPGVHHFRAQDA